MTFLNTIVNSAVLGKVICSSSGRESDLKRRSRSRKGFSRGIRTTLVHVCGARSPSLGSGEEPIPRYSAWTCPKSVLPRVTQDATPLSGRSDQLPKEGRQRQEKGTRTAAVPPRPKRPNAHLQITRLQTENPPDERRTREGFPQGGHPRQPLPRAPETHSFLGERPPKWKARFLKTNIPCFLLLSLQLKLVRSNLDWKLVLGT